MSVSACFLLFNVVAFATAQLYRFLVLDASFQLWWCFCSVFFLLFSFQFAHYFDYYLSFRLDFIFVIKYKFFCIRHTFLGMNSKHQKLFITRVSSFMKKCSFHSTFFFSIQWTNEWNVCVAYGFVYAIFEQVAISILEFLNRNAI